MKRKYFLAAVFSAVLIVVMICLFNSGVSHKAHKKTVYAVLPLTGSTSELGQMVRKSIDMYVANNTNMAYEIIVVDAESSPQKAVSAIQQKIVGDAQPVVITTFSYLSNAIISPVDQRNGFTFAVATYSINQRMTNGSAAYQRVSASTKDIIRPIADYAKKFDKILVIHSDDEYAMNCKKEFENFTGLNKIMKSDAQTFSIKNPDVREIVTRALRANPDAVYVTATASMAYINVFKELFASGYKGEILTDIAFSNPFVYQALDGAAEGVIFTCTKADVEFDSKTTIPRSQYMTNFIEQCHKAGLPPYMITVQTYDTLALIDSILKKGKIFTQNSIVEMSPFASVAGNVVFSEGGNSSYPCELVVVRGKRICLKD